MSEQSNKTSLSDASSLLLAMFSKQIKYDRGFNSTKIKQAMLFTTDHGVYLQSQLQTCKHL